MHAAGKIFVKTCLKAIRVTFFSQYWDFPICDIFIQQHMICHMILGDNPAGHCFVLRDLILIEIFQICHNCVTECMLQAIFLLKLA